MEKIRIGLFGAGRGINLALNFMLQNCEIVALCDFNEKRLTAGAARIGPGAALYRDFDSFIEHDMDAVILANYFHEHTPYAIRCFEKGLHVFCECISNGTMAEGVELIRAFEKSSSIYMLAENYPQMLFNREIQRVCAGGTLGRLIYAEGEYNHPGDPWDGSFRKQYTYFEKHWRNHIPSTYYITHSLGPIMKATGATPRRVSAYTVYDPSDAAIPTAKMTADRCPCIVTQNDDGSIFRLTACGTFGGHHNAYRVCGTKGSIENLRDLSQRVLLHYNAWQLPEGAEEVSIYLPDWNDKDEELIKSSGHGGGDYITARMFLECIEEGRQPEHPFDIYSAVTMSSVAILAHRSVMEGNVPFDIPDFRTEEARAQYENDRLTPCWGTDGSAPNYPSCSHPDYHPTEEQLALYRKDLGIE